MNSSYTSTTTKPLFRGTQVVWYILGFIEAVLAFRFVLKLMGANPNAGFTDLIYSISGFFLAPFRAVFNSSVVSGSVFEWSTLLGMLVYWVIALGVIRIFMMSRTVSTPEAAEKLSNQETI